MCYHTLGTGMSEAPVLVPNFLYAAEGGARPSSYFRQGNWESETNCLKIFDEKIAPQAKFVKQIEWIMMCTRFFWMSPGPIAFHWENGEIRCGLWGVTQKKVWAAGSTLSLSGLWSPSLYELWALTYRKPVLWTEFFLMSMKVSCGTFLLTRP